MIIFNRLQRDDMTSIVKIQMRSLEKRLADRKMSLVLDDKALEWLANKGFDPEYGARPLKRVIQRYIQDPLSLDILSGKVKDGAVIKASIEGAHLVFSS